MDNQFSKNKNNRKHRYRPVRTVSPEYEKARIELMNEKAKAYRQGRNASKFVRAVMWCIFAYMIFMGLENIFRSI